MAKDDYDGVKEILQELERNKFVKSFSDRMNEHAAMSLRFNLILVIAVLLTILVLNYMGKLSMESNGWIIAALIGYLFGRGQK